MHCSPGALKDLPASAYMLTGLEVSDPVLIAASCSVITEGEVRQIALPQVWSVDLLKDLQQCGSRGLQCGTSRDSGDGQLQASAVTRKQQMEANADDDCQHKLCVFSTRQCRVLKSLFRFLFVHAGGHLQDRNRVVVSVKILQDRQKSVNRVQT